MANAFDVMVIGGGTAGLKAALRCANAGKKVLLIDPSKTLGGTCLNSGCIPTKAMLHASTLYRQMQSSSELGIENKPTLNFPKLMKRVRGIIAEGQEHIERSLKKPNLTILHKKVSFIGPNSVTDGKQHYGAKHIIIATGAKNIVPPIPGLDKVGWLSNEDVIALSKLPSSLVMIGGGYISMEFATFFAQLGVKVTVLEKFPRILTMLDDDVLEVLVEEFTALGITIHTDVDIKEVSQAKGKKTVSYAIKGKHAKISADALVVACGRAPNAAGLDCEKADIKMGPRGNIEVDDYMHTSNGSVYAIGDVNGRPMFAHAAKREMEAVLSAILSSVPRMIKLDTCPWAVFTHPTVAGVGLSERQCVEKKLNYSVLKADFSRCGRAHIMGEEDGFVKVMYDTYSKRILGAVIVGPHADDLIHEITAIMNSTSPTIHVLERTIHVHPTLAEVMDALDEP